MIFLLNIGFGQTEQAAVLIIQQQFVLLYAGIEAASVSCMTCCAGLDDLYQQCIVVAVAVHFNDLLEVAGGRALVPQLLT